MQKKRPKAEPEATGNTDAEARGRGSLGGLWTEPRVEVWKSGFQPWLHWVWGKPQKPRVALGFPSVLGTILSPQSASSRGWEVEFSGWLSGFTAGAWGREAGAAASGYLSPSWGSTEGRGGVVFIESISGETLSLTQLLRHF